MNETSETRRERSGLGLFALGVILGAAVALGVVMARGGVVPATNEAAIRAVVKQELSAIDFKSLARQGALEAIQEDQQQAGIASAAPAKPALAGPIQGPAAPTRASQASAQVDAQVPLGNNIIGEPNAKVTIIEYSDFQ